MKMVEMVRHAMKNETCLSETFAFGWFFALSSEMQK